VSTTTIRLPDDLKERVAAAAEKTGQSPHSFILQAIAEKAQHTERQSEFLGVAEQRFSEIAATGKTIAWDDMRAYLQARAEGKAPPRPRARKTGR
jgi:predicted transcriptional regulator